MSIYTGKGDDGLTFCMLLGKRIPKDHPLIEFLGCLDEANSLLGVVRAYLSSGEDTELIIYLQRLLFRIGFTVSGKPSISEEDLSRLEEYSDRFYSVSPLKEFILPGGDAITSNIHLARAVVRRVERRFITVSRDMDIPETDLVIKILNRLSDMLFAYSLYLAKKRGVENLPLHPRD